MPETETPQTPDFDAGWDVHSESHPDEVALTGTTMDVDRPAEEPAVAEPAKAARTESGQFAAKGKKRDDPVARMKDATEKEATAKRERDAALDKVKAIEAELSLLKRPRAEPAATDAPAKAGKRTYASPPPDVKDYIEGGKSFDAEVDPLDAYNDARADWREQERSAKTTRETAERESADRMRSAGALMDDATKTDPTFAAAKATCDRVVSESGYTVPGPNGSRMPGLPPALFTALTSSANVVSLTREFAAHPELLSQWIRDTSALPGSAATVVQRALDALVDSGSAAARSDPAPKPKAVSQAKPPVSRVGGSANAAPLDEDDESFEDAVRKDRKDPSRLTRSNW